MKRASIIEEIVNERNRQDEKWGEQNHNPVEWMAILMEEVGEVSKEALEYHFKHKDKTEQSLLNYRKELIQTAAVTLAMLESLERNELNNS